MPNLLLYFFHRTSSAFCRTLRPPLLSLTAPFLECIRHDASRTVGTATVPAPFGAFIFARPSLVCTFSLRKRCAAALLTRALTRRLDLLYYKKEQMSTFFRQNTILLIKFNKTIQSIETSLVQEYGCHEAKNGRFFALIFRLDFREVLC